METQEVRVCGHQLRLFVDTEPYVRALADDIRTARQRAWVESYTILADDMGRLVAEALQERAAAGVDCRLLYDAVGSYTTPAAFFADMQAAGVKVEVYRPISSVWWRWGFFDRFNRRDHRKLAVVDDRVAYFGGMNVVDQRGPAEARPNRLEELITSGGWRDVQVRLEGPQQAEVAAAFENLWGRVHLKQPVGKSKWPIKQMLSDAADGIYFFDSRPTRSYRRPSRVLTPLLAEAQRNITVAMAYFIPLGSVLRELVRARKRGVEIRVIVPSRSDVRLVEWASRHMYEWLLRRGIRIYERQDRMLHSKVMAIDGRTAVIGSCNIDPRSFLLNLEFLAVIRSAEAAAAVERICKDELRHSRAVRIKHARGRSWWERLLHRWAWYFRRWL